MLESKLEYFWSPTLQTIKNNIFLDITPDVLALYINIGQNLNSHNKKPDHLF